MSLPAGYSTADVGAVGGTGSANEASGTWTLVGHGADIQATADEFRYAYKSISGDFDARVHVASITGGDTFYAKGVIMARNSTATGSIAAWTELAIQNGAHGLIRTTLNGSATGNGNDAAPVPPYWIRLQRIGNFWDVYRSSDGTNWGSNLGGSSSTLTDPILLGLGACSHFDDGAHASTIVFDTFTIDGVLQIGDVAITGNTATGSPGSLGNSRDILIFG